MGFVSLMSWMSDYIDSKFKGGYRLPTGDGTSALVNKTLYAITRRSMPLQNWKSNKSSSKLGASWKLCRWR